MFLASRAPMAYADPWAIPLHERVATLRRRATRVAYYYERPDSSTFRYRVFNMVEALNRVTPDVSAAWFCEADVQILPRLPELVDVLVVARCRYSYALDDLITRARARGCRVVFDVDDLVFNADLVPLVAHTLAEEQDHDGLWDHWYAYIGRMRAAMRLCDRVVVTNDHLAMEARGVFDGEVRVIANFLNEAQLRASEDVYQRKVRTGFARSSDIHLGYFSGSPSHNRDFEVVSDVLATMFDADPRLRLTLVGYLEVRGGMLRHARRIDRHPLQDFVNLQLLIGSVELNLAPLQANRFTDSKSELKYFEAAAVGTLTIASRVHSLDRSIRHGETGFLAGPDAWEDVLRQAIAVLDGGADGYAALARRARAQALAEYSWERQGPAIVAALLDR